MGNDDGIPTDLPINAAAWWQGTAYYFDNGSGTYLSVAPDGTRTIRPTWVSSLISETQYVDTAWVAGNRLYLTGSDQYVRYTLADGSAGEFVDDGYPKPLPYPLDAAMPRGDQVYLFSGSQYTHIGADREPTNLPDPRPLAGAWAELPGDTAPPFDAVLDSATGLYLFVGDGYYRHAKRGSVPRPYEYRSLPFEIIRLTTGTASDLNRKLLSGGVPALLELATQETDEVAVSTDPNATAAVRVNRSMVDEGRLPTGSHLDFRSANGIYYWEIFFHAPLLIAQALNSAQRFEDARRWYEYIFDPTNVGSYWRFLPFLTVDPGALADSLAADLAALAGAGLAVDDVTQVLTPVVEALRALAPAVAHNRDAATDAEKAAQATVVSAPVHVAVAAAVTALGTGTTPAQQDAISNLREHTLLAADLEKLFNALGDRDNLLKAYRDNPFDPHAIAELRPVAYRRAVVMGYVDNPPAEWYASLHTEADLLGYLTSGGAMVEEGGAVHAGVANAYFSIPDNSLFEEYRDRVEDRLHKIRESLNILGISQPLPLFAPPVDAMALVRATAAGADLDSVAADTAVPAPHYRFTSMFGKARDLVDRLTQYGSELLSVLERGSAEELSLLQNRQEKAILALTVAIKQAQVGSAEETVAELTASQQGAQASADHYQKLIDTGQSALEKAQIGTLGTAAGLQVTGGVLKVAASIAYEVPQVLLGPFILGTEEGGQEIGDALTKAADATDSLGQSLSTIGEILGIQAQYQRMAEDWQLQLATARNDVLQIGHQLSGAQQQLAIARREADILAQEIANNEAVGTFLTGKFANAALYNWMAGRMSGLYFRAYHLAYETAKVAERAYQFEHGVTDTFIQPVYWESRRNGLLAGASLGQDLDQLGMAHLNRGGRSLEITKQISLLEVDPVAMLRLRTAGTCEFTLTEEMFDEDFPGHYQRQIRTVTVSLVDAKGQTLGVNGTLTQLSHKTVLEADPRAVKHLLDPTSPAPLSVRSDWRASQQIALSQPDGGRDNNGLFELRFDDERYLPFEGTGAVSTWRLDRALAGSADLYDVYLTVKYTAQYGGDTFATAVKGMLKPHPAARFFDLARDFPDQWAQFAADGSDQLVLPFTPDMFPGMAGRQISGIFPAYELTDGGSAHLLLGGDPNLSLDPAKLLPTPGLTVGGGTTSNWTFTLSGDKEHLSNIGLVLTYQARVQ
ncbi:MAG: hypothetical protein AUI14_23825 [Actinobacteria bacterium 13_2_20CM_2_71_6]|nr:MAG: hypothetical protein AUI14_23825 [Actinobacteria bacterium 13_2_20CM_2_71_6]